MGHQIIFKKKTSSVIPVTGDVFISTATFISTSGGSQSNPPHQWVWKFQKGAIPAGYSAALQMGGLDITTQYRTCTLYPDGSLNIVVFYSYPGTVGAGATFTYSIYRRSFAYSSPSSRTISDITAHDFKTVLSDLRDDTGTLVGSGVFNCSANTNLAVAARTKTLTDGANALEVTTWGKATDNTGGVENAFLTDKGRYTVWTDPANSANVYAICHNARIQTGWRNVASPHAYTFRVKRYDGATVLLNLDGTTNFVAGDIDPVGDTIANTTLQTGQCVFLTFGSLPGASASTPYWARRDASGTITLYKSAHSAWLTSSTSNRLDITGTGSGTLTIYFDHYYHTGSDVMGVDAKPVWTANEPFIEVAWTNTEVKYLQKAGAWWNFDLSASFTTRTTCDFYKGSLCAPSGETNIANFNLRPDIDDTGEHIMLYNLGYAASQAVITRNQTDLRVARVLGYCGSQLPWSVWLDETTSGGQEVYTPLTLNNGSDDAGAAFSGMGTPLAASDTQVNPWPGLGSGESATQLRSGPMGYNTADHSHYPHTAYLAFFLSGDPLLVDTLYNAANEHYNSNASGNTRTVTYQGTTYYNSTMTWLQQRSVGYAGRDKYFAAICAPSGSGISAYFSKSLNDDLAFLVAVRNHEDSSFATNGMWTPYDGMASWNGSSHTSACNYLAAGGFQSSVLAQAFLLIGQGWGTSNATTVSSHFAEFERLRCAPGSLMAKGPYWANFYYAGVRESRSATTWRVPGDWGVTFYGTYTWGASNTITAESGWSGATHNYANDDRVWFAGAGDISSNTPPAEITVGTKYWVIGKSGNTFKISLTQGGSAASFTAQGGASQGEFVLSDYSATGFRNDPGAGPPGYAQMVCASVRLGSAYGVSGHSALVSDLTSRQNAMGAGWEPNGDPRFAISATAL